MHKIGGTHLQYVINHYAKKVNKYDQEIPQSQTADKPMAPQGRATQQSQCFNKKKLRLLELQIKQTRHPKSVTNRRSGPITRPSFAKAMQVKTWSLWKNIMTIIISVQA